MSWRCVLCVSISQSSLCSVHALCSARSSAHAGSRYSSVAALGSHSCLEPHWRTRSEVYQLFQKAIFLSCFEILTLLLHDGSCSLKLEVSICCEWKDLCLLLAVPSHDCCNCVSKTGAVGLRRSFPLEGTRIVTSFILRSWCLGFD